MTFTISVRSEGPSGPHGAGPWAEATDGDCVGYAWCTVDGNLHLALGDDVGPRPGLAAELVDALVAATGLAPRRWFVRDARPRDHDVAAALGLVPQRELWQMRRRLPLEPSTLDIVADLDLRPFVPGRDEEAWVGVNNRAFARHPDQGHQSVEQLLALEAESWFDPAGFLLHGDDDGLDGFCWTKVHADADPRLGEIYVIGVDPSAHGHGLGRALVVAGLDWLHRAGLTVAMLYVDADNTPAVGVYRDLGFVTVERDVVAT